MSSTYFKNVGAPIYQWGGAEEPGAEEQTNGPAGGDNEADLRKSLTDANDALNASIVKLEQD